MRKLRVVDISLTDGPVEIIGALDFDRTETGIAPRRLPAWTRPQIPDLFMDFMVALTSGVRLAFRTDSPWIELDAMPTGFAVVGPEDVPTLPDGLHPDGNGYLRIGRRFAARAFAANGPFAR